MVIGSDSQIYIKNKMVQLKFKIKNVLCKLQDNRTNDY